MQENLKKILKEDFKITANRNQLKEISRLLFEIESNSATACREALEKLKKRPFFQKRSGKDNFFYLRDTLIKLRFPRSAQKNIPIPLKNIFLPEIRNPLTAITRPPKPFKPLKIFIEEGLKNHPLTLKLKNKFPSAELFRKKYYAEYLSRKKFSISELKKPFIFLIKERQDFIKHCPCTKYHLGCGYWIFNLGFGCPFDCSYCYLQQYSNFPGLILPANIEDFFEEFDAFYHKIQRPIRIGTGEFCDSLALDEITGYSVKLVNFFRRKNVLFELKTKSDEIKNLTAIQASPNIIISWSVNPQKIIETEELCCASVKERINCAKILQKHGYTIALHFDPVIHLPGWKNLYRQTIKSIYEKLCPPLAWISIGTLRSNRELKIINELRFPRSSIFHGELLMAEDRKLRYPEFLRIEIYKHIVDTIKSYDKKTPIYLCMEKTDIWKEVKGLVPFYDIEGSLINANKHLLP
ncbi:MAG: hypothetical protein GF375_02420 [Candidatus Omnitrophica bacterium]|nr:hypothetical protein [Candidatus Omnitrophota bacterium]MBD3268955.1 hypothetical protein [Candidatus Omnitrophota bacterium]